MKNLPSIQLGDTSIAVSRLSFGTVLMGPRGENLSPQDGADLLTHAYRRGINYWDTSEDYGTHPHIAQALRHISRQQVIISSKLNLPVKPIDDLLQELNTTYIDILLVHDVSLNDIDATKAALQSWQEEKSKSRLRAIGISTHSALVAKVMYKWPEVEVMMLPINMTGVCLPDQPIEGGIELMKGIAEKAWTKGKAIIAMKVMGFGSYADRPKMAIAHVANLPYVHSLCIGMRSQAEIDQNVHILCSL